MQWVLCCLIWFATSILNGDFLHLRIVRYLHCIALLWTPYVPKRSTIMAFIWGVNPMRIASISIVQKYVITASDRWITLSLCIHSWFNVKKTEWTHSLPRYCIRALNINQSVRTSVSQSSKSNEANPCRLQFVMYLTTITCDCKWILHCCCICRDPSTPS